MSQKSSILYLYKCILRSAQDFPSIRRAAIVDEIKIGTINIWMEKKLNFITRVPEKLQTN